MAKKFANYGMFEKLCQYKIINKQKMQLTQPTINNKTKEFIQNQYKNDVSQSKSQ